MKKPILLFGLLLSFSFMFSSKLSAQANAGEDQVGCTENFTLSGSIPQNGTGIWSIVSGSADIANPSLFNTNVLVPRGITILRWSVTDESGTTSDDLTLHNQMPTEPFAGEDQVICESSTTLNANAPIIGTGQWTIVAGMATIVNPTANNTQVFNLSQDYTVFRWTVQNESCINVDEVLILNNEVTANAGYDFQTCTNNAILSAMDPVFVGGTGKWSTSSQAIVSNSLQHNATVTNLAPGINNFNWTVTKGNCLASDIVEITNNKVVADAGENQSICDNQTQMNATEPILGTGLWTKVDISSPAVIATPTSGKTMVTNLSQGITMFTWTVTNGACIDSQTISISNNSFTAFAGLDEETCNSTITLFGYDPGQNGLGIWDIIQGGGTFSNSSQANSEVADLPPGLSSFRWTVTKYGCTSSDIVDITYTQVFANAGPDVTVCEDRVQLDANTLNTGETGQWSIDGGAIAEVFSSNTSNTPLVNNLRQGITTFAWTVRKGVCTDIDRVSVINDIPTVFAGPDLTVCEDYVQLFANNPDPGSNGIWTMLFTPTSVTFSDPTSYHTTVNDLENGKNQFIWKVTNANCSSTDTIVVIRENIDVVAGPPYTESCTDTLKLEASIPPVGTTGYWTAIEGGGSFDNPTSYTTIARNLKAYNKLRWTIVDGSCSYYDEIEFVSLLTTKAKTQSDTTICTNTTQITSNPPSAGESGQWTILSGSGTIVNPSFYQTMVNNLGSGSNHFLWTISNSSCSSSNVITVINNQVVANAGPDKTICTDATNLGANIPILGEGYWTTTTPGVIISNNSISNTEVSNLAFGNNNFQWTVKNGNCTNTDEVIITSNLPRNVSAGADQNICKSFTSLAATNPGIGRGLWEVTGGAGIFTNATTNQTDVSGISSGENIFKWTVTVGTCSASSQVKVFNNGLYVTAGTDKTICNVNSIQLDGTQPGIGITGSWSVNGGTGIFANPTQYNTTVSGMTKGNNTYRWTLSDGNCSNYADVKIINNTPDSAKVGAAQFICENSTTINAIPVSNGIGAWSRKSGSGSITTPSSANTKVTGINTGLNTFTWTVSKNGCSLSADIDVTNNSVNAYIANDSLVICTSTHTATISGNSPDIGENGYWTKLSSGPGTITNSASNVTTVIGLGNGVSYFSWTVRNGTCYSSDMLSITNNYYNTTAVAAGPGTLCVDYSPILGGPLPFGSKGIWSSSSPSVVFDNNSMVATTARNLPQGVNNITWTITRNGCSSSASLNLQNNAIYTNAGTDQLVCDLSTTTLNAQPLLPGETGIWTVNNSIAVIENYSDPTTRVSSLVTGDNTFTWTLTGSGCSASDQVIISYNAFNVDAGIDQIVCGHTVTLRGSNQLNGNGLWTLSSGSGNIVNPTNFETLVENMGNGANVFTWTIHKNTCVGSDNIIIINDLYVAVAGDDFSVCSHQSAVNAQPLNPASGAVGRWTTQTGGGVFANPNMATSLVTGLSNGDNRLRWTVTKGTCVSSDEIIITNNTIVASAGVDQTTCDNFTTLNATPLSPTASGIWTQEGTGGIVNPSSAITEVKNLKSGINTFTWTVTDHGCTGTSTVKVTCNKFSARAGNDQIVGTNNAVLSAVLPSSSATGEWSVFSGNGIFTDANNPTSIVTNLGYGTNKLRWTVTWNGCNAFNDVDIIYDVISAKAGTDQTICTNDTYLHANDPWPGTGSWSLISGSGTIANTLNSATQVSGISPGSINVYRWTVTMPGVTKYDDIVVTSKQFNISAGIDRSICCDSVTMSAEHPGNGNGSWIVLAGSGNFTNPFSNTSVVTNLGNGLNIFVWTVNNPSGCTDSDTIHVTYNIPPEAYFETDVSGGCSPLEVEFTNKSIGGSTFYWNYGNGQSVDYELKKSQRTYQAAYTMDTIYTITLTALSGAGCSDTLQSTVQVFKTLEADAGMDSIIYDISEFGLQGNYPFTGNGTWTSSSNDVLFNNPSLHNAFVSNIPAGQTTFTWTITNECGSSSDDMILTHSSLLYITDQPQSQEIIHGCSMSFGIHATGQHVRYRWRKNGNYIHDYDKKSFKISDTGKYEGTGTNILTIYNVTDDDAGVFDCEITDGENVEYSQTVTLTVITLIESLTEKGIKVYPNPTRGQLFIEFTSNNNAKNIIISDLYGKKIIERKVLKNKEIIDLSNFAKGMYLINIQENNKMISTKIIIQD